MKLNEIDWKSEAVELVNTGKNFSQTAKELIEKHKLEISTDILRTKISRYIRKNNLLVYNGAIKDTEISTDVNKTEYKNGVYTSDRLIEIMEGEIITPETILKAHNMNPQEWEVVSYRNNLWNAQKKGGDKVLMYQSRVSAKPRINSVDFKIITDFFENYEYDAKIKIPQTPENYNRSGKVLEICLPDFHGGLLAWRKETGEDYDIKIAKQRLTTSISDIIVRCKGQNFSKIVFVTLGDLLHVDNDEQKTTKGTFQQTDGRIAKIFTNTLEVLILAIEQLRSIAPVEVIYIRGNHDGTTGYTLLKSLEMAFRNQDYITFDTDPNPQKHRMFGRNLIGWTHGDMPQNNMRGWLMNYAKKDFGNSNHCEIHAGHFHTEKVKEVIQTEDKEGIVIRYLPTICPASYWEHQQGYSKNNKAIVSFVWDEELGLREMWFSGV